MSAAKIVLVGEVVIDVTLQKPEKKLRLGGVLHAARALWAIGVEYDLAYFAPAYVDQAVADQARRLEARSVSNIGSIEGSPNVMLIDEPTEAGDQGYDHLLRDAHRAKLDEDALLAAITRAEDVIILSGNFSLPDVLKIASRHSASVHTDLGSGPGALNELAALARPLGTLFLSTSSQVFSALADGVPGSVAGMVGKFAEAVLLKENRGGARLFSHSETLTVGAQRRSIMHSVGVGDVFDSGYVAIRNVRGKDEALHRASWRASEYAATTFPVDFKRATEGCLQIPVDELKALPSVRLAWEERRGVNVYVAAPDFSYLDRSEVEKVAACLRYHNFSPRLPVRENGQAKEGMSKAERSLMFAADMALLEQCQIVLAVLSYDDPGTYIEIGIAGGRNVPVVVYDPHRRANNVMLTELPNIVSNSLDEVVTAIFDLAARQMPES
jgi:nucleoside 2-deoxyribosyltransferase/sugar/nucleoside kinase (ribokinase family)